MNTIRFCEPYTAASSKTNKYDFHVTNNFLRTLKRKPKYIKCDRGNAYIFGKRYKINDYIFLGEIGNDGGQCGLVDITEANKKELVDITQTEKWLEIFMPTKRKFIKWDDRTALQKVQKNISERILFVGETFGGDVGAALFGHFDQNNNLNSIIIDVFCIFE